MSDNQTRQLKEIEALLAERRTFEQWLEQLEAHRDATPTHVYLKIRADYQARFDGAQARLGAETASVRALVQGMESALRAQDAAIGAKADERAEAEIRAAVGEFTAKEWDKRKAALDSAIGTLESERATKQREMETLRALLNEATPIAPAATTARVAPVAPGLPVEDFVSAVLTTPVTPPIAVTAVEESTPKVDDVAFLTSVLGRATPPRTPLAVEAPTAGDSGRRDTPLSMPADQARESGAFPRASKSFGNPTPKTSEAQKSLTCSACGALNFPTEWYCEKCGGELAAF